MKLKDIKQEWKTVLIALCGLIGLSVGLFYIAGPILGTVMALTAAGPISGGIVATIIVQDAAKAVGAEDLLVFATLLLILQTFVGLPIASLCLKLEGNRLLRKYRSGEAETAVEAVKSDPEGSHPETVPTETPAHPFVLLAKIAIVSWIALLASQHFNAMVVKAGMSYLQIHKFVMALIMGILFYETGFLSTRYCQGQRRRIRHVLLPCSRVCQPSLATCRKWSVPSVSLGGGLWRLVGGIVISTFITSMILRCSWAIATAAVTCLFGFPGTFIVTDEVTTAIAKTPEEKEYTMSKLLPKMLVEGSPR